MPPRLPPLSILPETLTSHWAIKDFLFPEKLSGRAMNQEEGSMETQTCSASHTSSAPQNFNLFNFNYKSFSRFCWKCVWRRQKINPSIMAVTSRCFAVSSSDADSASMLFHFPFLTVIFYWDLINHSQTRLSESGHDHSLIKSHIVTREFNFGSFDEYRQMEEGKKNEKKKVIFKHVVMVWM